MRTAPILVSILLSGALVTGGCSGKHESGLADNAPAATVSGVSLEIIKSAAVPEVFDVAGTVRARTIAAVSARVPGSVSLLRVREGDRVKKGQLLAQLEARESQASAAAAEAAVEEARRGVDEADARNKLADITFGRYQKLFNEQAISRQEFDVKQTEKDLAIQALARAESRLKQAKENSNASASMSGYTRIVAPVSGLVASKQVDLGASVFPGQPLMTIEDDSNYQLELALPENLSARVRPGTPLQVTLDAVGSSFEARIAEVVPTADPASRTFLARINLTQKGLKSGMFGRGVISTGSSVTGVSAPQKAIVERGALTFVWTVDKDSRARMRIVKVGRQMGQRMEILSGLSDGDRVIVTGVEKVTEAAKVE